MAHMHGIPNHICMLDGPDYPDSSAQVRQDALLAENERLKALLLEHGISWALEHAKKTIKIPKRTVSTRLSSVADKPLPHIPMEIQLRILGYAMKCSTPIIDPFFKHRNENITKDERMEQKTIPVQILTTCKAYYSEGFKFLFNNDFVFTQVAALDNFAKIPLELRSTVKHVTLRIVGRYYDDEPQKRNIFELQYHPAVPNYKLPILGRPKGSQMDQGVHAYCWQQFADFLMKLQIPRGRTHVSNLFPCMSRMRVDLVNFCDHLHYPGPGFATVIRWHTGALVDELIMTGIPEDDPEVGPEAMFTRLVKDEGVFASGPPIFVSMVKSLKPLPPLGLSVKVVRADEETVLLRTLRNKKAKPTRVAPIVDAEGGKPPKSFYPPGRTIWKFTQDSLVNPKRKWIEFDRESGYPADDIDMWSDMGDSVMYDSEGIFFDLDEDMDDEDEDSDMPELVTA